MFNFTPTVRNLLIANLVFFLAQTSLLPLLTQVGSLYPIGSPYFYPWQFFTYMFLHGSWGHLFSNMFGLIVFGPLLEQRWGPSRFLTFWLICGVGAGVLHQGVRAYETHRMEQAQQEFHQSPSGADFANFFEKYLPEAQGYETLANALARDPNNPEYIEATTKAIDGVVDEVTNSRRGGMLGASGALFGILFAFAYLFPNTKLFIFPLPVPIAAKYLVFGYTMLELYQGIHRTPGDNVAHFAHLGGLLIGFIVLKFWQESRERFY
ncbi:MAG TPA: rhomboid family intramembrane serine protease [Hymenobacter sp.]|jgi:membrane associated rhomboid family serine protease|uniref:rhomboid family intramembrane serine protease n=1 Tax=Hymenobacter sp. TaxID=1898978 RepID=UPI002EDB54A2